MASVIRGDDNFDSSSVGPSTDLGAVGTYAFVGLYSSVAHAVGNTVAGSTLFHWQIYSSSNISAGGTFSIAGNSQSASLSGTWRWLGSGNLTGTRSRMALAVRIS